MIVPQGQGSWWSAGRVHWRTACLLMVSSRPARSNIGRAGNDTTDGFAR
jgi:hypothetical protein